MDKELKPPYIPPKEKLISEDDRDKAKEAIQELTKKFENSVTDLARSREADVMDQ